MDVVGTAKERRKERWTLDKRSTVERKASVVGGAEPKQAKKRTVLPYGTEVDFGKPQGVKNLAYIFGLTYCTYSKYLLYGGGATGGQTGG